MNSKLPFLALLLVLGLRCVNSEILPVDYPVPTVNSSVFLFVNDVDGQAVSDAVVTMGDEVYTTDAFGTCLIQNQVMPVSAYLTVQKAGFFNGSRRLYIINDQLQYAQIVLLARNDIGSFAAASGGEIDVDGFSSVTFPKDAVIMEDGTPYTGEVQISGYTILADDPELFTKMPGNLEGQSLSGQQGVLSSYGMMTIELHTTSGEKLNLKNGHRAKLKMYVPESLRSSAPAEIPMWYFDEETGEWKGEGIGVFNGIFYEAEVKHFTTWNCDDWNQSIEWRSTFVDESGQPLTGLMVCLTIMSSGAKSCSYTNSAGTIYQVLPIDERIQLSILDDCDNVYYSREIGPFDGSVSNFGTETVPHPTGGPVLSTITGIGVDCYGDPIKNGIAFINISSHPYVALLNPADGSFEKKVFNCSETKTIVTVLDQTTHKVSPPKEFSFSEIMQAGTLQACEQQVAVLEFEAEGFPGQFVFHDPNLTINYGDMTTSVLANDGNPNGMFMNFDFHGFQPGQTSLVFSEASITLSNGQTVALWYLNVRLDEFGPVGGLIKGRISGALSGGNNGLGGTGPTNFSGTFSGIRRQ